MRILVVSSGEDRHHPVLLPRNASDTCVTGCFYTSAPTTFYSTSRPFKSTSQPAARSKHPTWAPTRVTTTRKDASTTIPTLSPFFRTILTTLSPTISKTKLPYVEKSAIPTKKFVSPFASPTHSPSVKNESRTTFLPSSASRGDSKTIAPSKAPSRHIMKTVSPSSPRSGILFSKAPYYAMNKTSTGKPSLARAVDLYTKPPTQAACMSRSDGTYGTFSADTATAVYIDYNYRLEAQSATTVSTISSQVLPPLEKAIIDQLIPTLFAASCGSPLNGASLRELVHTKKNLRPAYALGSDAKVSIVDRKRNLENIVGITSNPPDLVQATCTPSINATYTCVIVKGRLTVYETSGATNLSNLQLTSVKVICGAMSNGQLTKSQPSIVSLQCINTNNTASITMGEDGPAQIVVNRGVPFYSYIIGAAAFGIVLIAIFVYIRRKMSQNRSNEDQRVGVVAMETDHDDATDSNIDPLGDRESDDDLGSIPSSLYDAHNLLVAEGIEEIVIPDNKPMECPSSDSLDEDFEISSDCDSTTAKGDGPVDAYDFAPVLCSISSPRALASFAKSSYFPEETDVRVDQKEK